MRLNDHKLIFIVVGLVGVLLISSPAFIFWPPLPEGEPFSEIYLLGPSHMIGEYPFNIVPEQDNSIYLGVSNHVGSSAYYVVYVKLLNESDFMPNSTLGTPSPVEPLCEYRFLIQNNQTLERSLTFSVPDATFSDNLSLVKSFKINDSLFNVNKPVAWNASTSMYQCRLLFELWMYNSQSREIMFNSRLVALQLNLTQLG